MTFPLLLNGVVVLISIFEKHVGITIRSLLVLLVYIPYICSKLLSYNKILTEISNYNNISIKNVLKQTIN